MKDIIRIFDKDIEYDFLSGWIKYTRLNSNLSQEYIAHGICSTSHLSYFENGKKKLKPEIIESILKKLGIYEIKEMSILSNLRTKFYNLVFQIESLNYEGAKLTYNDIAKHESFIMLSPYSIEYRIYQLMYNFFVEDKDYAFFEKELENIDKIFSSLPKELKYIFLLISGKINYTYIDHTKGIERLISCHKIKETPLLNYHLGFSYCFNDNYLKGIYYFEKSLSSYENNGQYLNALWCHNYLGICFTHLEAYDEAEKHFLAALNAGNYLNLEKILWHIYVNFSHLYYCMEDYEKSIIWSKKALSTNEDPTLPAYNFINACIRLDNQDECKRAFDKYLNNNFKSSRYYPMLNFLYLKNYHLYEDIFYEKVTKEILPFYEKINYIEVCKSIKLSLIEHLEKKRKYKEANNLYRQLLRL